jgi:glycosyltransferase involved in cell wall biosynthesis
LGDAAEFARQSLYLLDHPEERSRLGEAARRRIETDFTVGAMVDRYAALYLGN